MASKWKITQCGRCSSDFSVHSDWKTAPKKCSPCLLIEGDFVEAIKLILENNYMEVPENLRHRLSEIMAETNYSYNAALKLGNLKKREIWKTEEKKLAALISSEKDIRKIVFTVMKKITRKTPSKTKVKVAGSSSLSSKNKNMGGLTENVTMRHLARNGLWVRSKCTNCGNSNFNSASKKVNDFPKIIDLILEQIMNEYPCGKCKKPKSIELKYEVKVEKGHGWVGLEQQRKIQAAEKAKQDEYQPALPKTKSQTRRGFTEDELTKIDWSNT